jgi:mannan endo-1,4-beta-mannosidase
MLRLLAIVAALLSSILGGIIFWTDHPDAGRFHVDGTTIIGPDEKPFVPLGVNMLGPDAFFNETGVSAGQAKVLADAWKVNTVRLNMCLPEGCHYNTVRNTLNDDLDGLIKEYTGQGIVVMLALHQVQPGGWPDPPTLDRIDAFWREQATRYGRNPMVWFNLMNEPGTDRPADHRWADIHARLLHTVRDAGAKNMVVMDGTVFGQESGDGRSPVATQDSALLSFGKQVMGDDDAVAFSFHVYNGWGYGALTDAQRDARMADYIDRVHAAGLPLLIGETGGDYQPCCTEDALGTESAFRVAPSRGVGIIMWHGQAIDGHKLVYTGHGESQPTDIDDWTNPTNLTWQGQLFWDLTHGR